MIVLSEKCSKYKILRMKCIVVPLNEFKMHSRIFCTAISGKFEKNIYQHVLLFI